MITHKNLEIKKSFDPSPARISTVPDGAHCAIKSLANGTQLSIEPHGDRGVALVQTIEHRVGESETRTVRARMELSERERRGLQYALVPMISTHALSNLLRATEHLDEDHEIRKAAMVVIAECDNQFR